MSKNNQKLIIILVFLVLALFILNRINDPRERRIEFFNVSPDNIHTIELMTTNDTLRVTRDTVGWTLEEPFVFPADQSRMDSFFEQVLPVQTSTTPVSVSEESHNEYFVTEQRGTLLSFFGPDDNLLDRAYVGRRDRTTFARRPGEDNVYQLLGHIGLLVSANANPWRSVEVLSVPRGRISSIEVEYELNTYNLTATDSLWLYTDSNNTFSIRDNNQALNRIFEHLESIPSMRFIDYEYEEYEHLLENPRVILSVTEYTGKVHKLEWGYDMDEGDFVVKKDGVKDHLYYVDANISDRFTIAHQHFQR